MFSLTSRTPTPSSALASGRDPFSLMDTMLSDWFGNRMAPALASRVKLEVSEHDDNYEVRAELPGVTKDDIAIEIDGASVSISAKTSRRSEKKEGEKLLYSEFSQESYARAFELPQAVDSDRAVAKFENGVLSLTLPKKDVTKTTRLKVE